MHNRRGNTRALTVLLGALFLSGSAGLVNQVVWQRALKVFLGGSETLSSMTVVVVFMFGLGAGSVLMGVRSERFRNPVMVFAVTEVALASVNFAVRWLLGLDISESIYSVQRLAVGAGVQLRVIYIVAAVLLLGGPCFLMGMTMPLSSESIQRQLRLEEKKLITLLFFVNTVGAVVGALGTGFYLLPHFGQRLSLLIAAGENLFAGVLLAALAGAIGSVQPAAPATMPADAERASLGSLSIEDVMGFLLGFFSLSYEMFLFRLMTLAYGPLPYTFAATLCVFLALWSLGVHLSRETREAIVATLLVAAALVGLVPRLFSGHSFVWQIPGSQILCFVPCVFFGLLYGHMVSRSAKRWGRDVGRFYALNTLGSCLGIVLFTLVGYEVDPTSGGSFLAAGLLGTVALWNVRSARTPQMRRSWKIAAAAMAAAAVLVVVVGLSVPFHTTSTGRVFYGRDGVIEVTGRDVIWDGLWHSSLSVDRNHIGTNNWLHAVAPLVAHEGPVTDALVIGLGAGITSSTLSEVDQLQTIDTYDINHTLRPFLAGYGPGTLAVATNPRVHIIWQDGRSGLALHEKKYDLITQQPLYLKQAGSSILLSREYLKLAQARMKPGAVMTIYSNSQGNDEEALLVRQTAKSIFQYCESFEHGYMVIASDSAIDLSGAAVTRRLDLYPAIKADVAWLEAKNSTPTKPYRFYDLYDSTRLPWTGSRFVITDDHPLVEYPNLVRALLSARY